MDLKGARVLLTGGSSGIGRATAELLMEAGATVAITGRNLEKLNVVAEEIGAIPLHFDISNYDEIKPKTTEIAEKLGGIDVLINNAGIGEFALLGDLTIKAFEQVFATNVFGLAMLTQEVLPYFQAQNQGHIINIASSAGLKGFAHGTIYSASKFALRSMTQCWQAELRKQNIRVILVNPSEVPTAFNRADRTERPEEPQKLTSMEIAHTIKAALEMDNRGFIPEVSVWATNPFTI